MTLIISSKSLLKRFQLKKPKKQDTHLPDFISCLPKELLVCIYQQLSTPECTHAFAATSRLFRQIATQPRSKAAWMVTRLGPRYALYYALLNAPEHCSGQFIHTLFHLGAQLPRSLLQALLQHYGKPVQEKDGSETARRRSSATSPLNELYTLFSKAIQRLSFDGYATIIQKGHQLYHKQIQAQEQTRDDLSQFMSALTSQDDAVLETMVYQEWFLLSPFTMIRRSPLSYQAYLQLIQTRPGLYAHLAPIFEFDVVARISLWEACLMVLFEESFRSSELTADRLNRLEGVSTLLSYPTRLLVGPWDDRQLFCQVFSNFFTKYPKGYCQASNMHRLIELLYRYGQPVSFHLPMALEYIVQAHLGREDTIQHIEQFLQKHP